MTNTSQRKGPRWVLGKREWYRHRVPAPGASGCRQAVDDIYLCRGTCHHAWPMGQTRQHCCGPLGGAPACRGPHPLRPHRAPKRFKRAHPLSQPAHICELALERCPRVRVKTFLRESLVTGVTAGGSDGTAARWAAAAAANTRLQALGAPGRQLRKRGLNHLRSSARRKYVFCMCACECVRVRMRVCMRVCACVRACTQASKENINRTRCSARCQQVSLGVKDASDFSFLRLLTAFSRYVTSMHRLCNRNLYFKKLEESGLCSSPRPTRGCPARQAPGEGRAHSAVCRTRRVDGGPHG